MYLVLAFSLYWQDGSEVRKPLESIQRESPAPKLFCCLEINFCRPSLIDWCNHCDDTHSFFNPWLWHVCRFHPTSQPAAQAVLFHWQIFSSSSSSVGKASKRCDVSVSRCPLSVEHAYNTSPGDVQKTSWASPGECEADLAEKRARHQEPTPYMIPTLLSIWL